MALLSLFCLSWRTSRRPLVSNPRVHPPTSCGRRESCCPYVPFLPVSPGAHPHGELCVGLCLSHRDDHLVCEPSFVSITSACLEQRGCVRGRFCGAFLVGNTPLYLEGRNMRRLEGSGRKEPSLIILRGRDGISRSMCGKWRCSGNSEPPALQPERRGVGFEGWSIAGFHSGFRPHQVVSPSRLGTPHLSWTHVLGLEAACGAGSRRPGATRTQFWSDLASFS